MRVPVEDQLQQARPVADDLAARDLLVVRLADLVGDAVAGQLLLGAPDGRDLGDRVDRVRHERGDAMRRDPERVTGGEAALLEGGRGEAGKADDVADRVDVRNGCAVVLVDDQAPAPIGGEPGRVEVEPARGPAATDRVQRLLGDDVLAADQVDADLAVALLVHVESADLLSEPEGHAALAHVEGQSVHDLGVDEREQARALVDERHPDPERREHARVLEADHTGADHGHRARQPVERDRVVAGDDRAGDRRSRDRRAWPSCPWR